jgi:hypothetical protein
MFVENRVASSVAPALMLDNKKQCTVRGRRQTINNNTTNYRSRSENRKDMMMMMIMAE